MASAARHGAGSSSSAASSTAISAPAVARRTFSPRGAPATIALRAEKQTSGDLGLLRLLDLLAGAAEAPLAAAIGFERFIERSAVEVRPKRVGEVKLRVGELPQQEIADALLAAGADKEIGLRCVAHGEIRMKLFFRHFFTPGMVLQEAVERLHDVPAAAIVRRNGEREAAVPLGQLLRLLDQPADLRIEATQIAHHLEPHAVAMQLFHLVGEGALEELHEQRHFLRRTAPVLRAEREQGQVFDAPLRARLDRRPHRLDAALVAGEARQMPAFRPASVAIHDDRHVAWHGAVLRHLACGARVRRFLACAHMDISSFSFSCSSLSISPMCLSVAFCTSSCARRSSFSETSFFFSASLRCWMASRRRLRTATRAFSASCFTTLISSLRRSSVSEGIGRRMVSPEVEGLSPRSDSRIPFSIVGMSFFSKGVTPIVRESRSVILATWLIGVGVP